MPDAALPEHPSLEYLKKLAKDRLRALRTANAKATLATAQLAVAREHGFPSWRALKAEVDRRRQPALDRFFAACSAGDLPALAELLAAEPGLARARGPGRVTGLHLAVRSPEAVRLLLQHGADPNARDEGDNATPLHGAAGHGALESVRALLDAGADPQGEGDLHRMDVIGWATCFAEARRDVVALLVGRGARHHIFSAIAMGEVDLVRRVVADDPKALRRRLSRFEQEQTALHYVVAPGDGLVGGAFRTGAHYRTLETLIALGADLEARDAKGRTPLGVAMLRGDAEAMRLLHAAGAKAPAPARRNAAEPAALAASVKRLTPMVAVPDIDATVAWYQAVGFTLAATDNDDGPLGWALLTLGNAALMLVPSGGSPGPGRHLSLWFYTDRLDDLYAELKERQVERSRAVLAGEPTDLPEMRFVQDLYTAFYGQREFGIVDPNGVELMFAEPN